MSQISFKYASTQALPLELSPDWLMRLFLNPWLYGAIAGYLGAFVTWMTLLRYAPVGPSFAASHLELISVTPVSYTHLDVYKRQALPVQAHGKYGPFPDRA